MRVVGVRLRLEAALAIHIPEQMRERVLKEGLYLARIHDGQFELEVPNDFQPREF